MKNPSNNYITTSELTAFLKEVFQAIESMRLDLRRELSYHISKEFDKHVEVNSRTLEELKELNKNIIGIIAYHEDRIRLLEKKSYTHPTDML